MKRSIERPRNRRRRAIISLGVLVSAAALATAALSLLTADVIAELRASEGHDYNIQVAAKEAAEDAFPAEIAAPWVPAEAEWKEGNPVPIEIGSARTGSQNRVYAVAVRNASPRLSSKLCLSLSAARNAEAFDDLRFTLAGEGAGSLIDAAGRDHPRVCTDRVLGPGDTSSFALRITGGRAEDEPTIVRLRVDGSQQ